MDEFRTMTVHVATLPKIPVMKIITYAIVSGITSLRDRYLGPSTLLRYSSSVNSLRSQSRQKSSVSFSMSPSWLDVPMLGTFVRMSHASSVHRDNTFTRMHILISFGIAHANKETSGCSINLLLLIVNGLLTCDDIIFFLQNLLRQRKTNTKQMG